MLRRQSVPWWHKSRQKEKSRGGRYTAMCVRMCDGFYFPLSHGTSRGKFYKLAQRCSESCGSEAKLFYMPSSSDNVALMTDLSGRAYDQFDNAFLYRKKLIKSCTCKPMPWSHEARSKHAEYAAKRAKKEQRVRLKSQRVAALNVDGANDGEVVSHGAQDDAAAAQPQAQRKKRVKRSKYRLRYGRVRVRRIPRRAHPRPGPRVRYKYIGSGKQIRYR